MSFEDPADVRDPKSSPDLADWEADLLRRYPEPEAVPETTESVDREESGFRNYDSETRDGVQKFYYLNHTRQTVEFVREMKEKYLPLRTREMSIWEAMEFLNQLVDDSDPDTELPQIAHAVQTAEAIRADGHPDWFVLTGLIHDLGKVLCLFGEPQWAVVGDTFPVGCAFSDKIILPEYFAENPDSHVHEYQTLCGLYQPECGLDNVSMSWGHDEYLYQVVGSFLPVEAQYMVRYHSFYPAHREGAYQHLMNETDKEMFDWVRTFNRYDLYTKHDVEPDLDFLMPYYEDLVAAYFPKTLQW